MITRPRLFVLLGVLSCGALAYAQPKPKPQPKPAVTAKPTAAPKPAGGTAKVKDAGVIEHDTNPMASDASAGTASTAGRPIAEGKFGDGGKTFKFGELEVEGRLRSPQLVYFLRRVRAEFAAGDLGHRSFMLELGQTRQTDNF